MGADGTGRFSRKRMRFRNKPEKACPEWGRLFLWGGDDSDDAALRLLTFLNLQNHNV
jgi:hypothetical protein